MKQKGRNRESEAKRKMQKSKEDHEQRFMMSGVEGPHQPKKYSFPSPSFGTKGENRCFKGVRFQQWLWLDCKEPTDSVVCFYCSQANQKKLMNFAQKVTIENINFLNFNFVVVLLLL